MLDILKIDQPRWKELINIDDIFEFVDEVGFPVLIRPSYVLSGAAMNVVSNKNELSHFLKLAAKVSKQYPVVVSEFIENAKEIEIDAVAKDGEMLAYAIRNILNLQEFIRVMQQWSSLLRKYILKQREG